MLKSRKMAGKEDQKRILLCLYTFLPLSGPRSLRWLNLIKVLDQLGWIVDVLTVQPSVNDGFYDSSLLAELPVHIRVFRTYPGVLYSLIHMKNKPVQGFPKTTMEWLPFGLIRGRKILKEQNYSLIVSSALPFVGHCVAYFLKRKAQIPWVADYGDPLGFNPISSPVKRLFGSRVECCILKAVDGIIVPFEEMKKEFLDYYPFLKEENIRVIGHGIPEKFESIKPESFKKKFVVSFVGSFYKDAHEPYEFFQAFHALKNDRKMIDDIQVVIAGNVEQRYVEYARSLKIDTFTKFLGHVSYERAISILKGSSVILYIGGRRADYHFPSKILGCAASGRPIIAVKQSEKDLGSDFIEKNNIGRIVSNKKEEIERVVRELYHLWAMNKLDETFNHIDIEKYYWEKRGEEVEEFISHILCK